jgi:hypothetical protein
VITVSSIDQAGNTASATVSITVSGLNNAPVAEDQSVTTPKDTSVEIILKATDADGDLLTYIIVDNPSNGTVTLSGNTATYTPDANYNSPDSFTFKANDGTDDSNIATVLISVNDIITPPTITNASATPSGIFLKIGKGKPMSHKFVTRLNATVLDADGVANVTVDLSTIGGLSDQPMTQIAGTDVWTVTTYATSGISQTHELVVTATDVAGNTNTSSIYLTVLLRGRRSYV